MVFRGDLKEIPSKKIGSLVIHSSVQITSQAIAALSENGCSISWVNGVDKLICSTDCDNIGHVQRRKHQYRLTDNMRFRLSISKSIIISKLLSHCEVLSSNCISIDFGNIPSLKDSDEEFLVI